jgi:hypothetical protein
MQTGFDSVRRDLQMQIDDLKGRLDLVEIIVRQNSRDLMFEGTALHESWSAIQRNSGAVEEHARELGELKTAIERIEKKLDENADRDEVEALARRVAALEAEVLGKRT